MDDDLGIALFQETSIVITCCFHFLGRNMPKHAETWEKNWCVWSETDHYSVIVDYKIDNTLM
jgi:hypothetical protein